MSKSSYVASINSKINDNTARQISAADVRESLQSVAAEFASLNDDAYSGMKGLKPGIGTIANLKGITTSSGISIGSYLFFRDTGNSNILRAYELVSGTDAESSPDVIRPNDYASPANQKVWKLAIIGGGSSVDSVTGPGVDDTDPANPVINPYPNYTTEMGEDIQLALNTGASFKVGGSGANIEVNTDFGIDIKTEGSQTLTLSSELGISLNSPIVVIFGLTKDNTKQEALSIDPSSKQLFRFDRGIPGYGIVETRTGTTVNITDVSPFADHGKTLLLTNSGAIDVNFPMGLPNGFFVTIIRGDGAGEVTIVSASLKSTGDKLSMENTAATILHVGSDVHYAFGALGSGDIYFPVGTGPVVRTPDDTANYRLGVDNSGDETTTSV